MIKVGNSLENVTWVIFDPEVHKIRFRKLVQNFRPFSSKSQHILNKDKMNLI